MPRPEVLVHATFSTEEVASKGSVVFTDNQFSVDAQDGTIYTPTRLVGYLDQNGYMRTWLPLNTGKDDTPEPRAYHCDISVEAYTQSFDFVLSPTWSEIDLATIIPVGTPPTLPEQYVASVAGMVGNVSAQQLIDVLAPLDPLHGQSAYELWLGAGNTGTLDDFFNAYRGYQGFQGVPGGVGPDGGAGIQGVPGPAGPQGKDFEISGMVDRESDLPDGAERYDVYVTLDSQEFWLNIGNDQWQSMGSYKGVPGTPGDVSGGDIVGTNYFVSPEPSRLDGWSTDFGTLSLVPSTVNASRTLIQNLTTIDRDYPLKIVSPQTATPALGIGDTVWVQARAIISNRPSSPTVIVALRRKSTGAVLASETVTAGPAVGVSSFGYTMTAAIPAGDLFLTFTRSTLQVANEQLRVGDVMITTETHETPYFDGSSANDATYNYAWLGNDGYSASKKTTLTTKYVLGLDNVDNTHDLDKPISTATQAALDDVEANAGQVKSVNLMVGDVIVDKNSVGLDQVANLSPANLPVSSATATALSAKADASALDALKLTQLDDVITGKSPVTMDALLWNGAQWDFSAAVVKTQSIGANQDLDAYVNPGKWIQPLSLNATLALHYPVVLAGLLEVSPSDDGNHIFQRYTAYGRGGAVNTDLDSDVMWQRARYAGVWTLWKPMAWGKPTVWANAASGWNGVPDFTDFYSQNWGDEVYLDTVGRLRSRPQFLLANAKLSTDLPASYPLGMTIMGVSGSAWPGSGVVTTFVRESGSWTVQTWATGPASSRVYMRYGSSSWGAWEMVAGPVYSESTPLVAYAGWAMTSSYMNVHGHTVMIYGNIKRTGGTLTSPAGDITNTNMCYIASGLPYPTTSTGLAFLGGNTLFGGVCGSDRVLTVSCISPGKSIDTNDSLSFSCVYLTNNGV